MTYQTEIGQLLDLTSADLDTDEFKLELHTKIVKYKTAFYSFYLPVALGMVLSGIQDPRLYSTAQDILVDIGVYFQVQDDFLDGFQDPEILGKKGTDIEDRKCSWLVIQALQRCSRTQRAHLKVFFPTSFSCSFWTARRTFFPLCVRVLFVGVLVFLSMVCVAFLCCACVLCVCFFCVCVCLLVPLRRTSTARRSTWMRSRICTRR